MATRVEPKGPPAGEASPVEQYVIQDPERFALNMARALEQAGKAAAAWVSARETGKSVPASDSAGEMVKTFSKLAEYWLGDPMRTFEAHTRLLAGFVGVWTEAAQRLAGAEQAPAAAPAKGDKRFKDPEWQRNAFFNLLQQLYFATSHWAEQMVDKAEGLDPHARHKASFYVRQAANALSPSNFLFTNPELLRDTVESHGENLVRGMAMLAEDIAAGEGELRLRQSDLSRFAVGRDLAVTPGKVIARSELAEIIQYEPATEKVLKRPLVICPPWINKYYILDLNAQKSLIRWMVEQGHTVFVISWVNPDEHHASMAWEDYIEKGLHLALGAAEAATGEREMNAVGYCVGGTLLAAALALMARDGDRRVRTVTFLTTQVDFSEAGDLKVFIDEEQIAAFEREMGARGFLPGPRMAATFNLLRSNDLIWPYIVNNYLRGREPPPFDLLHWNADATRMTAANHAFYLRQCYLDNRLSKGEMRLFDRTVSLRDIEIPVFNLATREDHIAPARSVFLGCKLFGGPVDFVLAGSGHIAGVVNPPAANKYQFWTGGKPEGAFDAWLAAAQEHPGSWWPHWQGWIERHGKRRVRARKPGERTAVLGEAPGDYVRVQA